MIYYIIMSFFKIKHDPNYKLIIFSSNTNNTKLKQIDIENSFLMLENFLKNCQENKFKFIQLFDIRNINMGVNLIMRIATFYKKYGVIIENYCICSCLLFQKTAINDTFIKLFNKLYTPTRPLIVTTDEEKVKDFMNENLKNNYDATFTISEFE